MKGRVKFGPSHPGIVVHLRSRCEFNWLFPEARAGRKTVFQIEYLIGA